MYVKLFICFIIFITPAVANDNQELKKLRGKQPYGTTASYKIEAWACDKPKNIISQSYNSNDNCGSAIKEPQASRSVRVTVLQEERRRRHEAIVCSVEETRLIYHCGNFDHISILTGLSNFNVPKKVTYGQCAKMISEGVYELENGEVKEISKDGLTVITYTPVGRSFRSESGEIVCWRRYF